MKLLSQETGVVYMITDKYDTGTFLSADLMAVKPGDLNKGIYYQIAKASYFRVFQMNKNAGKDLRTFILTEIEKQIGADAVTDEIKKIRQQNTVNGKDIDEEAAKDELCSQWLAEILLKNAEGFAKENPDAANFLRKAMQAADGHLYDGFYKATDAEEYHSIVEAIEEDENYRSTEDFIKISDTTPQELNDIFKVNNFGLIIKFNKLYGLIRKNGNYKDTYDYHNLGADFAKKIYSLLSDPLRVILKKDGRLNIICEYQHKKNDVVLISIELDVQKKIKNHFGHYNLVVTTFDTNENYQKNNENQDGSKVIYDKKTAPRKLSPGRQNVPTIFNEVLSTISISTFFENVNSDFTQQVVDRLAAGIKGYRAEQFGYRSGNTISPIDSDFDPDADWDGYAFAYSDAEEIKAENDGADFAKNFDNLTPEERQQEMAKMRGDIDSYMNQLSRTAEVFAPEKISPEDKVSAEMPEDKKNLKEKMADALRHPLWFYFVLE